jgi:hypothetical protein
VPAQTVSGEAATADDARARAEAAARLEAERLVALWSYHRVPVDKGRQLSASIYSRNNVDTGVGEPRSVQLVFRDHSAWGRSSYLVLQSGDFDCYRGCRVQVSADDAAPRSLAARRPSTDEAIALFINHSRALWRLTEGAKQIAIEFPVQAGGTRTATFDVGGLDRSKMPEWDAPAAAAK